MPCCRSKEQGMDINAHIFEKKSFNNPSLYEKLIGMMAIDQNGFVSLHGFILLLLTCHFARC